MGHGASLKARSDLQRRLDGMSIGAPGHPALLALLEELFTERECRVAAVMPFRLASTARIARNAGLPEGETDAVLRGLVPKGLVVDFDRPGRPTLWFLNPAMIGFFEFTMMRPRPDIDQAKAARLMWEYVHEDPAHSFLRMAVEGPTFLARPLVHDDQLDPEDFAAVLDEDRALAVVESADSWAEGLCHCRHVALHRGRTCSHPPTYCLALGTGADYLVRAGIARPVPRERAREVVEDARRRGLVQMLDNVRRRPTFLCNCCKCCCEMMIGFRTLPGPTPVVSSRWTARIDPDSCTGCGRCAHACPVDAVETLPAIPTPAAPRRSHRAEVRADRCIGCGVCRRHCTPRALHLDPAPVRVHTPAHTFEKLLRQALERGRLGNLLFDDPTRLTHRTLSRLCDALLRLPPARTLLARQEVRSAFLDLLLAGAVHAPGGRAVREVAG